MENSQLDLQSETIDKNTIMQLMREIMEQEGRKIIAPMLEEKLLEKPKASRIYGEEWIVLQNRLLTDEPVTLREIGERYNVTRERVRQLEARLLEKIRQHLAVDIKDFSDTWIQS